MSENRVPVRRTAKLYIKGEFPRSESGRSYEVSRTMGDSWHGPPARPARTCATP
jgi:hypothetical protein